MHVNAYMLVRVCWFVYVGECILTYVIVNNSDERRGLSGVHISDKCTEVHILVEY